MKNLKKLLSLVLSLTLTLGVVLSVPFTVNAGLGADVWGDYITPGDATGAKSNYVTLGGNAFVSGDQVVDTKGEITNEGANKNPVIGYIGKIANTNAYTMFKKARDIAGASAEIPNFVEGQHFGDEDINTAYDLFPTITFYVYADHAGEYRMQFRNNSDANGADGSSLITRQTILVNDRKVYTTPVNNNYTIREKTIELVRGYNFIRFYLFDNTFDTSVSNYSDAWANLFWVRFQSDLVPLECGKKHSDGNNYIEFNATWSKNYNGFNRISSAVGTTETKFSGVLEETTQVSDGTTSYAVARAYNANTIQVSQLKNACNFTDQNNKIGNGYNNSEATGTATKTSYVPFVSYSLYVQEPGYYNITSSIGSGAERYWKGKTVIFVDGKRYIVNSSKIGTLANGFYNGSLQNSHYYSLSVYLPKGEHSFTFTAPFSYSKISGGDAWFNFGTIKIFVPTDRVQVPGNGDYESLKKTHAIVMPDNDRRVEMAPVNRTNTDVAAPTLASTTDGGTYYVWADTNAVHNSQTNRSYTTKAVTGGQDASPSAGSNGNFTDSGFWQVANGNGRKYKSDGTVSATIGAEYAFSDTGFQDGTDKHYIVGNLASVSAHIDGMQSWRSIADMRYINKSYLPMITYQIKVDEAGVYQIEDYYRIALNTGFSYDDYYQVISVNDNQFMRADFIDFKDAGYTAVGCSGVHNRDSNGGVKGEPQYDPRKDTNTAENPTRDPSTSHFGVSRFQANLSKGVNYIRCIVAVKETATMVGWCNMSGLKIHSGPGKVEGLKVKMNKDGTQNDPNSYKYSFKQETYVKSGSGSTNASFSQTTASDLTSDFIIPSSVTTEAALATSVPKYNDYAVNVRNYGNGVNGTAFNSNLGIESNPNPRASNYTGGIVLSRLVDFLPENKTADGKTKPVSEMDFTGLDSFYENLYSGTFAATYFKYGIEEYLGYTPHLKYVVRTDASNTNAGEGYYDMDICYKTACIGNDGEGNTDGSGETSTVVKTEYKEDFFTVIVIDQNGFGKTYKRYFNEDRSSSCNDGKAYFDLTANLSVYLQNGTNTLYIIPPVNRNFYDMDQTNKWADRTNWFDMASVRIGLGTDYTTILHPTNGEYNETNKRYEPGNYDIITTIVEGTSYDAMQNFPAVGSDATIGDQLQFNEYRDFAYQYIRKLIQDMESEATGELTGENTKDWDAVNELSNTIKNITHEEARKLGAEGGVAANFPGTTKWKRAINYLMVSKLEGIEGLLWYDKNGKEVVDDDITKVDIEQTILHKRVVEFQKYKDDRMAEALENSATKFSELKATLTSLGTGYNGCDMVLKYCNERIPLFFDAIEYTNGRLSYERVTWYIDDMYNKAVDWSNHVYAKVQEFKTRKWQLSYWSNRDHIKANELSNSLLFGSDASKYKGSVPVSTIDAVTLHFKNLIEAEHFRFDETTDDFLALTETKGSGDSAKTYKGVKCSLDFLMSQTDSQCTESINAVNELYNTELKECKPRIVAFYNQTRLYTQYEVEKDFDAASDDDMIYVNVFFTLDNFDGVNNETNSTGHNTYGAKNNYSSNKTVTYNFGSGTETLSTTAEYGFFIFVPGWGFGTYNETMVFTPTAVSEYQIKHYTDWNGGVTSTTTSTMNPSDNDGHSKYAAGEYYGSATDFVLLSLHFPKQYKDLDIWVIGFVNEGGKTFATSGVKLNFVDHYAK